MKTYVFIHKDATDNDQAIHIQAISEDIAREKLEDAVSDIDEFELEYTY